MNWIERGAMRLYEWLWGFLPDRCEMPGCKRQGVRGNENIVNGRTMCDYCHALWLRNVSPIKSGKRRPW